MSESLKPATAATLDAHVKLAPKASQTFLVSLIVLAGVSVFCAAALLSGHNDAGWAFLILTLALAMVSIRAWSSSQPDVDLHSAAPTILSLPDGTKVSTDSRTLRSRDAVAGLLQLCEAYQREPLPEPDGLVANGVPVPNSAVEAGEQVRRINTDVQAQTSNFEALVNGVKDGPAILQTPPNNAVLPDPEQRQ